MRSNDLMGLLPIGFNKNGVDLPKRIIERMIQRLPNRLLPRSPMAADLASVEA
jgi:hypothetical protein